jgi:hypothetical protein
MVKDWFKKDNFWRIGISIYVASWNRVGYITGSEEDAKRSYPV